MADLHVTEPNTTEHDPIDRKLVERLRESYATTKSAYRKASGFLARRPADHAMACAALSIAADMAADIEGELGELLGEIPF